MGYNLLLFQSDVVMCAQFIYWLMDNSSVYIRSIYEANNHSILVDLVPTEELDFNLIEDLSRQLHMELGRSLIPHLHIQSNRHDWGTGSERICSVQRGRNSTSS